MQNKTISSLVFNVQGIKSDINYIEKTGFKRITGVDVVMFSKQKKDTLITLLLDNNLINTKTWKIQLKSNNKKYIKKYLINKNVILVTPICDYNEQYFFTVLDIEHYNTFICKVLKEDEFYYLNITYYNPHKINLSSEIKNIEEISNEDMETIPE